MTDGVNLHWAMTGEGGAPVVLVHGSWGDHHGWDLVVPALSRSSRVLAYDRRGHSRSPRPAGQGSVREDVDDLATLIGRLGLAPAHVVGNSFGGVIVLRLAATRPDLFRTLIVHEPPLLGLLDAPADRAALAAARERVRAVLALLEEGRMGDGARLFHHLVHAPGRFRPIGGALSEGGRRTARDHPSRDAGDHWTTGSARCRTSSAARREAGRGRDPDVGPIGQVRAAAGGARHRPRWR